MPSPREPWSYGLLQRLLGGRADADASVELGALWPLVEQWLVEPTPLIDRENDWFAIELSVGSHDGESPGPPPPDVLSGDSCWFSLAVVRLLGQSPFGQQPHGLEFWFAPNPALTALTSDPKWDRGNLLGFDCLGTAGPEARQTLDDELIRRIVRAGSAEPPTLVSVFAGWLDDHLSLGGAALG